MKIITVTVLVMCLSIASQQQQQINKTKEAILETSQSQFSVDTI